MARDHALEAGPPVAVRFDRLLIHRTHLVSTAAQEVRPRRGFPAASGTQREVRAGLRGQGLVPGRFPVPGQQPWQYVEHPGRVQRGENSQIRVRSREVVRNGVWPAVWEGRRHSEPHKLREPRRGSESAAALRHQPREGLE